MKRGGFGKPYRRPPAGWPKYLPPYSSIYSHKNPALNGLTKFVNTTQVYLQPNQVGRPMTRPVANLSGCENNWSNGLPKNPWIGLGPDQYLTSQLPTLNQFTQHGTNDKGNACRLRGSKWVQVIRQWPGLFGFLDADAYGFNDVLCAPHSYRSAKSSASQSKYTTIEFFATAATGATDYDVGGAVNNQFETTAAADIVRAVDVLSGKITQSGTRSQTTTIQAGPTSSPQTYTVPFGGLPLNDGSNQVLLSVLDLDLSSTANGIGLTELASNGLLSFTLNSVTHALAGGFPYYTAANFASGDFITAPTLAGYEAENIEDYNRIGTNYRQRFYSKVTRTNSGFTFSYIYSFQSWFDVARTQLGVDEHTTYAGSITLSGSNTSDAVNADRDHLLSFWDLTDDNLYPWRMDGLWQIAPLVTRDEADYDVNPAGVPAFTVDDLRSPLTDAAGHAPFSQHWTPTYTQMPWFDPAAYGFRWVVGTLPGLSAATDFVQFALTGKIFGMPMPLAYTNSESGLYQAGYTPPAKYDFQNFFDYRAKVFKALQWDQDSNGNVTCGSGQFVDFYQWGYGEWLYDAIIRTGAQLPHCATQWTNNYQAMSLPPYAYIIQADKQAYDKNGQPGPSADFITGPGGVMAQKVAEILEVWPSYDFSRPAAADKFSYDETLVVQTDGVLLYESDGTSPLTADPGVSIGIWGGQSVNGFYSGCSMDGSGNLTLGTKWFDVPSDWASASGDTATCFGKLRFPTAPAILGRMNVVSVADITAARVIVTGALTCLGLDIPQAETVDLCAADMTVLASAVIPTRIKIWEASKAYSVGTVIIDGNGALQRCTTAGTSDASAPTWATAGTTTDGGVTWTFAKAGAFAVNETFTVPTALVTIAAAKYIVSHGAAKYEWDDNQRKGDFVTLDWLFDYRTNGENARLTGAIDCAGAAITAPAANNGYATFHQTQHEKTTAIPYTPCKPLVVCISPNGENFGTRGVTIPFPTTFNFDDRYGARWQMEIEQAQVDYLWQAPHRRGGLETVDGWRMDDGSCPPTDPINANGGTDYLYAHAPLIEARVSVPTYGGTSETDTAPTPPTGIGYKSPVTYSDGIQPPGQIGYDPATGNPSPAAFTIWGYRLAIEQSSCAGSCRFGYADMENLPCQNPTVAAISDGAEDSTGLTGLDGLI